MTFLDYFSHYGYLLLIKEKSKALNKFKIFKSNVEKQMGKSIKIVKYNKSNEYYGKPDTIGQTKGSIF